MAVDAGVLAEALAMVGGDDQPGPLQDPRRPAVDQLADLLVEIGHAIVVGVDGEGHFLGRDRRLVDPPPVLDQAAAVVVDRLGPEPMEPPRGQFIGIVGVVEVQEGEEWPLRLRPSRDPVQELAIDHRRPLAIDGLASQSRRT